MALAIGCGGRGSQPSVPSKAVGAQASAPAAEQDVPAKELPVDAQPADDDLAPGAKHGLIRGLEKLRESIPVEKARPSQTVVNLAEADQLLSSAKSQNMAAIREANRQVRVAGPEVNMVLLAVAGLRCDELACYGTTSSQTPRIDKLAAEGVRFTGFHSAAPTSDTIQWSVMTGLVANQAAAGQPRLLRPTDFPLPKMLWYAGYATILVGDGSLGGAVQPGGTADLGFEAWSGYRNSAREHSPWPEQFWYEGRQMRVLENADGKQGRHASELLGKEIARQLNLHRRGRPFFLCVAWPRSGGATSNRASQPSSTTDAVLETTSLARLDVALGAIVDQLKALDLARRTVLFLMGDGDDRLDPVTGGGASRGESRPIPLIVWAPQRFAPGVRAQRCGPCDILPTLTELADARRRPKVQAGTSLLPLLRRDRPAQD